MTVDVKVAGSTLTPAGRQYWASEASVVEDATSLSLDDTLGGVGSVTIATDLLDNTLLVQGADLEVTFSGAGTRTATVQSISGTNGTSSRLEGQTKMARLRRTIQASVVKTTIGDAIAQYFSKCGLAPGDYQIDSEISSRACVLPGWEGDCWEHLREMAAVEQFDIGDVDGIIHVRPVGTIDINIDNHASLTSNLTENIAGRFVETHLYDYAVITNQIVYPPAEYDSENGGTIPAGWRPDYDIIEVTPGEPVEVDVPLLASLTSVKQPIPQVLVGPDYAGPNSVYTVVTADGVQAINPAVWLANGGKVEVSILPDTRTLRIRVDAGENIIALAPYRIALTSGGGKDYSTLRIVGTGVSIAKKRMRLRTPVPDGLTDQEIASSTDSIFCRTASQMRKQLRAQAAGASRCIGSASAAIATIPNVFGERAGSIFRTPHVNYRVRSATTGTDGTSLSADRYTLISDLKAAWAGKTIADLKETWAGYTMRAFNGSPLRTENPTAPIIPVGSGYGGGTYGSGGYGG